MKQWAETLSSTLGDTLAIGNGYAKQNVSKIRYIIIRTECNELWYSGVEYSTCLEVKSVELINNGIFLL